MPVWSRDLETNVKCESQGCAIACALQLPRCLHELRNNVEEQWSSTRHDGSSLAVAAEADSVLKHEVSSASNPLSTRFEIKFTVYVRNDISLQLYSKISVLNLVIMAQYMVLRWQNRIVNVNRWRAAAVVCVHPHSQ